MCFNGLHRKIVLLVLFWMVSGAAAKDAIERAANVQVLGGSYQPGYRSEAACSAACGTRPNCWAADFNLLVRTCWFHTRATACSATRPANNIVHFRFVACYNGVHALGADRQSHIRDAETCVLRCSQKMDCDAIDFDRSDNSCWFHARHSACALMRPKPLIDHYKMTRCAAGSSSGYPIQAVPPAPVVAPPPPVPQPVVPLIPARPQNDQTEPIYVQETHAQRHAHGGTLLNRRVGWKDCVRACEESVSCKSVDHVRTVNTCWLHTAATACGRLSVCAHCTHYKLSPCGAVQIAKATCGQPAISPISGRILGGRPAAPHSWPWMITLRNQAHSVERCGSSLIGDGSWVLTTAHCVDEVILHPRFDPRTFDFDVALLKLDRKFSPSPEVSPICIPDQNQDVLPGTLCAVTGWGKPSQSKRDLHQAFVPIVGLSTCRRREWLGSQFLITDRMMCAGYENGQIDSCQGDSGGPLVCYQRDKWYQYGITSYGRGCGLARKPGVYARVSQFSDWIANTMRSH